MTVSEQKFTDRKDRHVAGIVSMLLGPIVLFGTVLMMNRADDGDQQNNRLDPTELTVVKQQKPPPKKEVEKPKPKPKPKKTRAPDPIAGLNSNLSGIDLGLSGLGVDDMGIGDSGLLGNTQASVMTEDSVDVMPQPKSKSHFNYPKSAKKQGIEGYVVLSVLIDAQGSVNQVKVLESSPQGVFDDSAIEGIRRWKFSPAQYQGKAVKVWAKQKIRFGLG